MYTQRILIVGIGGVGSAIARELLKKDCFLILADRTLPEEFADNPRTQFIEIDMFRGGISALEGLDIDGLYITSGIGRLAMFDSFKDTEIEKNFSVNVVSEIKLINAYSEKLTACKHFDCVVVSSISGLLASPLYALYSATKAALYKYAEAVNAELAHRGFDNRVLIVAPGRIRGTAFHNEDWRMNSQWRDDLMVLASEIVKRASLSEWIYIPNYESVYKQVLCEYQSNPEQFALKSIEYKLKNSSLEEKPQVSIGYLTGSFDLFHIGHLNLLRNAKKYCDRLVVGVHKDGSHKSKELFIPLEERMDIVRHISYVDDVIVCSGEDMDDYERVRFDFLFVGSDYKGSERFNRYERLAAPLGVTIVYLPYTKKTSSTQLRSAIEAVSVK